MGTLVLSSFIDELEPDFEFTLAATGVGLLDIVVTLLSSSRPASAVASRLLQLYVSWF